MNNMDNRFPFLYEIRTNQGNSLLVNISLIERIEYAAINSNWSELYLSGFSEAFIIKMTPEELYTDIKKSYMSIMDGI